MSTLNIGALGVLSAVVTLDLLLRLLLFGRLESVAIDIAIFSIVYSMVEFLRSAGDLFQDGTLSTDARQWALRFGITFFTLIVLAIVHARADKALKDQVTAVLIEYMLKIEDKERQRTFWAAVPIMMRSVVLTFVGPEMPLLREGKKTWRTEVTLLITRLSGSESGHVSDEEPEMPVEPAQQQTLLLPPEQPLSELLLPGVIRWSALVVFGIGGAACILAVVWPMH